MAQTTFNLEIIVDPSGAVRGVRKVDAAIGRVQGRVDKLRTLIKRAFIFVGISVGVRQLVRLADTFLKVQNRLRVVTKGQAQLTDVTDKLFGVARRTRSEFSATAELYTRLAINSRELGRNQQELLQFTESLNQAIIISGASAKEANSGLIQLSQGLASGVLRGDELRSVLEQLPTVADVISDSLGITRGELREFGTEGKISADIVIDAFLKAKDELEEKFGRTIPTIAQAFTQISNSALKFIGNIETSSGVTAKFALFLVSIADNFDLVARLAITAGIALSTVFVKRGIIIAVRAIKLLTLAIIKNPMLAFANLAIIATSAIIAFSDEIRISSDSMGTLADVGTSLLNQLSDGFVLLATSVGLGLGGALDDGADKLGEFKVTVKDVLLFIASFFDTVVGLSIGLAFALVKSVEGIPNAIGFIVVETINLILGFITDTVKLIAAFGLTVKDVFTNTFRGLGASLELLGKAASEALSGNFSAALDLVDQARAVIEQESKGFGEIFKENFDLAGTTFIAPQVENKFKEGALELKDKILDAMRLGLEFSGAADIIGKSLADAQAAGDKRQLDKSGPDKGSGAPGGGKPPSGIPEGFAEKLAALKAEETLLMRIVELQGKTLEAGAQRAEVGKIEEEFRKKGTKLADKEVEQLEKVIESTRRLKEEEALLVEIKAPGEEIIRDMATLNRLISKGGDDIQIYIDRLRELQTKSLETDKTLRGGLTLGFERVKMSMEDVAGAAENAMVNAFQSAEDALVDFVNTGKVDMRKLATSMISDITRIIVRLLILKAIQAATGTSVPDVSGTGPGGVPLKPQAEGGPVKAGGSFLVGEEGPELFIPKNSGQVIPNDLTMAALGTGEKNQQPQINVTAPPAAVQVVNVSDPDEISSAIESASGEQAIINVIQRNSSVIRRTLA